MKRYFQNKQDQEYIEHYNDSIRAKNTADSIAYAYADSVAYADSIAAVEKKKMEEEKRKITLTPEEIPQGILHGISAQELVNTVQAIADTAVRKPLIALLRAGDIIGAQKMFAMSTNASDPYNAADGKLDKRTLIRFSDPLFGLSRDSLLQSPDVPDDLKEVYKKFVSGEYDNHGKDYAILSKDSIQPYLFSADHKILYHAPVLTGAEAGDAEFTPYPYYKNSDGTLTYHGKTVHTDTP